jgi:ectoine hydroxylase-related dioxygenase (phytanoyl-CoA dioxygenase family)
MNDSAQTNLPQATSDLDVAKSNMDEFGYCLLSDALSQEEVAAIRQRVLDQVEAEKQMGVSYHLDDKKQLLKFLINKGRAFRDILTHQGLHQIVKHVLGEAYLLSSYNGHLAHPGGSTRFHTDQFWMPAPANSNGHTAVKPGDITRTGNRGHHIAGADTTAISPAVVCNAMWMLDDFTETNGATIVVPGSHLSGRQPDHELDEDANWVPAVAPAGSVAIFEGRTWHSTGANVGNSTRIGLTTNFCAPQFRQQENFLLGTRPEVLELASDELLALIGFKPWQGYGGYESNYDMVKRGDYAIGELIPE